MPQPLNTPISPPVGGWGCSLIHPDLTVQGAPLLSLLPSCTPRFWGLITVEDGDSKGIRGWEAWGRFWSRTRGVYEGRGDKVPQGRGEQPCLVDEKAYLFFTVQYLKRE